jgi:erythromycin esterase-like protein
LEAVIEYLERVDPEALPAARRAYDCFEPYGEDPQEYARATAFVPTSCEEEVVGMLSELRGKVLEYREDPESRFGAEQNALVARDAEAYYRAMVHGGASSWNV